MEWSRHPHGRNHSMMAGLGEAIASIVLDQIDVRLYGASVRIGIET